MVVAGSGYPFSGTAGFDMNRILRSLHHQFWILWGFLLLGYSLANGRVMVPDPHQPDTISIDSIHVMTPNPVVMSVNFVNDEPLAAIEVTLQHTSPALVVDSFSFSGSRVGYLGFRGVVIDSNSLTIFAFQSIEEFIPPGSGLLGRLFFSYPLPVATQLTYVDTVTIVIDRIEHGTFFSDSTVSSFVPQVKRGFLSLQNSCCVGITGNIDGTADEAADLGDLTDLIDYLFITPDRVLTCPEEANIDGSPDGIVDLGDLTHLIAYLFINMGLIPPAPCF